MFRPHFIKLAYNSRQKPVLIYVGNGILCINYLTEVGQQELLEVRFMQAMLFTPHADEAAVLSVILQQAGFSIRAVRNLDQAIEAWPERPAEFILISLTEDRTAAIQQIEKMRMFAAVPICVITDPLSEDQHVSLLESGADLVMFRPYGVRYLLAQIRALIRRSAGIPFFSLPSLSQHNLTLDPSRHTVVVADSPPKRLTQLEFRLLYTLMTHAGQVLPTDQIIEHVWGYSGEGNRELVRGLVQRLRAKIEPNPRQPCYIMTEPGIGYYFDRYEE
jgi:DNA-binding response OmpR family regulator